MQQCILGIDKHPLLIRGVVKAQDDPSKPARPSHIMHRHLKRKTESPHKAAHDPQLNQRAHY